MFGYRAGSHAYNVAISEAISITPPWNASLLGAVRLRIYYDLYFQRKSSYDVFETNILGTEALKLTETINEKIDNVKKTKCSNLCNNCTTNVKKEVNRNTSAKFGGGIIAPSQMRKGLEKASEKGWNKN